MADDVQIVMVLDSTKNEPSTLSEIKKGVNVTLIVHYGQIAKTWDITHVEIFPPGIF